MTIMLLHSMSWSELYSYFLVSSVHRPKPTSLLDGLWRNQGSTKRHGRLWVSHNNPFSEYRGPFYGISFWMWS